MIRKYILPAFAAIGVGMGIMMVLLGNRKVQPAPPVDLPSESPYKTFVSGAGIIEASTENIAIGTQIAGIVKQIYVQIGSQVKKDAPLFLIDDRQTRAQLAINLAAAKVAEANLDNAEKQLAFAENLTDKRAISTQEFDNRRYAFQSAKAALQQAQAQVNSTQTDLERLAVRAPMDGQVMQLKIHLGEFAPTGVLVQPLILFGSVKPMNVRVNVDEDDAWRVKYGAKARAYLRGNRNINSPLKFIRFEPYVIPKQSLTGGNTERVDTRVLQVIYSIEDGNLPIFVGQLMDIFIEGLPHITDANSYK